jgi:predicted Zn-ribbon and HTH transcriptional regulator
MNNAGWGLALMTIRKQIISLLESGPLTLREMSIELRLKESEVIDHLKHVARSVAPALRM